MRQWRLERFDFLNERKNSKLYYTLNDMSLFDHLFIKSIVWYGSYSIPNLCVKKKCGRQVK